MALKDDWINETVEILTNRELVDALQRQAPEVLKWLEYRLETARLAALFAVMPPALPEPPALPPPPATPPRRKPTIDEVRAKIVGGVRVKADDKIARKKAQIEAVLKARHEVDNYRDDFDSDELERLEQELIADILADEEIDDGNFKKL